MIRRRPPGVRRVIRGVRRRMGWLLARTAVAAAGKDLRDPSARASWAQLPHSWRVSPPPAAMDTAWPTPPRIEKPLEIVRSIYETGHRPPAMDVALLAALNEEYRPKPLVPRPLTYDSVSVEERARRRLLGYHKQIDLRNKRVLEFGCGTGVEVWYLSHQFGADAWGVDVAERSGWSSLSDDRTHLLCADIATDSPFEADYFDRVISSTVLEHVVHPFAILAEIYRITKPGGLVAMSANLYRGPKASHIYGEIHFPFPHLLFTDDVIAEYRKQQSGNDAGAAWVNRLTWAQYEDYLREIGFVIRSLRFVETPLDESLYDRFSDILGRYPRWDLENDFFHTVLEKPKRQRS
jgi:SAM-dependent methyltransferase